MPKFKTIETTMLQRRGIHPRYEYGFWWWYNHNILDWRIGCAPSIGIPSWATQRLHQDIKEDLI